MKKYLLGFSAIVLAIGFSAFTKPAAKPFATHVFKFKATADARVAAQVADKTNWEEGTLTCDAINELPCTMIIDEQYSHPVDQGGGVFKEVLNTTTDNPQSESILTIGTTNGYLDTAPNPDVQYFVVSASALYTRSNQSF